MVVEYLQSQNSCSSARRFPTSVSHKPGNIIEGKNSGTTLFIFDGLSEGYKTHKTHPRTYVACQTEQAHSQ